MYTLTHKNKSNIPYIKNKVDIVVLTRNKDDIATIMPDNEFINSYNIIESDFNKTHKGFAATCNLGAKIDELLGEFILFLNDDVIIPDTYCFMKDLLLPFKDESVGMVGAEASKTDFGINGSIMCIRRELFELVRGFDEQYFFMWEDNDMNQTIKSLGYKIEISKAIAYHKGKASINDFSEFWHKNYYEGKAKYEAKWNKQ